MSNIVAGDIFEKVIHEVVQASQTDFEENGVNQQTLLELKQTWQQKLSARNVAQMPWDPKPEPSPQPVHSQPSSAINNTSQTYTPSQSQPQNVNGTRVKNEPGPDQNYAGGNYMPQPMNPELAQQRAASLLQQQYGSQATASLGAMQRGGIALPGQPQAKPGLQLPGQTQQVHQYAQQLKQQQAAQQPRIKTETDGASDDFQASKRQRLAYAQTDGANDGMAEWNAIMDARRAVSDEQRAQADATMREYITSMANELESGLMQPLKQRKRSKKNRTVSRSKRPTLEGIPQYDGDFSEDEKVIDEDDENAINSDLDDSGDELHKDDDDDDEVDSMLCTYDKVQRVKNKWKCTLKDGVLSANGKEYLFHKAQGEFEW